MNFMEELDMYQHKDRDNIVWEDQIHDIYKPKPEPQTKSQYGNNGRLVNKKLHIRLKKFIKNRN